MLINSEDWYVCQIGSGSIKVLYAFMYDVLGSVPPAVLKNVKSEKFGVYVIILLCIIFGTVQI